jgi:copper homeostasis protein
MKPNDREKERSISLEICLDSVESCMAAERGGAHRVELCANLDEDGTTPSPGIIAAARKSIGIALHVMIRPRGGDFCYSDAEFEAMKRDIDIARQLGADGVVLGVLTHERQVDVERTGMLVMLARPMAVTFHRAFDAAADPVQALEAIIEAGASRLLTSGQATSAAEGAGLIRRLAQQAGDRIKIMAGVGITAENAREIRDRTGVREIHVGSGVTNRVTGSGKAEHSPAATYRLVDSAKVARVIEAL